MKKFQLPIALPFILLFCVSLFFQLDGMVFMVLGIMSEILPHVIGSLLIWYLDKTF